MNVPSDAQNPQWHVYDKVHGWRNYITPLVQDLWTSFTAVQRDAIAGMAQEIANREHWD